MAQRPLWSPESEAGALKGFQKDCALLNGASNISGLIVSSTELTCIFSSPGTPNSCPLVYLWHLRFLKLCLLLHFARSSCPSIHLPILDPCFLAACPEP